MCVLWFILIGAGEAWLASVILKRYGRRFMTNLIAGICGSILGGLLIAELIINDGSSIEEKMILAMAGSFIVLFFLNITMTKKRPPPLKKHLDYSRLE